MASLSPLHLQSTLDRWLHFAPCLGINVTLQYGAEIWHGAAGYVDVDTLAPMPTNGRLYIYSITKTFTAVRVLQLAADNHLSLNEPINHYLTDLPLPDTVTIHHLLNHTSGLPNYTSLPDYNDAVTATPHTPWSYEAVAQRTCTGALNFEPDTAWQYSNTGYMLLAKLIEKASGHSYGDNLHQFIMAPLGLTDSYLAEGVDNGRILPCYNTFTPNTPHVNITPLYHPWWCLTGLIASTTANVTHFYHTLMTGNLLLPTLKQRMSTPRSIGGEAGSFFTTPSYGYGLMIDPDWEHGGLYGHGGSGPGCNSWAMHLPSYHGAPLTLTTLTNTAMYDHPFDLVHQLLARLA